MKKKVYLRYMSNTNNQYIYDDASGNIFQWNNLYEEIINMYCEHNLTTITENLLGKYNIDEIQEAYKFLNYWINKYHAFYRDDKNYNFDEIETEDKLYDLMKKVNTTLLISLTDQCNLRCRYCIYSEEYEYTKEKSNKYLDMSTANKIVKFYLGFIKEAIEQNPTRIYNISFYGGEPLLNLKVMLKIIDSFNKVYPRRFQYNVTTNGLGLTLDVCKELEKRHVNILVSLDGPKEENDRLRIDLKKKGSFDRIINNLKIIKNALPDYYASKMGIAAVYDYRTNIIRTNQYFGEECGSKKLPPIKIVNRVSDINTNYYSKFSKEEKKTYFNQLNELKKEYVKGILNNRANNSYLNILFSMNYMMIMLRKRAYDLLPADIPIGGSCFPGQKLFIETDGKFNICERVNGSHSFGNVDEGINMQKVAEILLTYKKEILRNCVSCPITKICPYCFMNFEQESDFQYDSLKCKNMIEKVKNNLCEYSSLLEIKPDIKFVSNLENILRDEFINI